MQVSSVTATYPARTDKRFRGVVYGYPLLDHASVMADAPRIVPNDYVGQTRQRGRGRELQHRDDKPWSDLIVGDPLVLWEADCTQKELDDQERAFIRREPTKARPRMNWKLNEDNPYQIPKWVQVEQRHARDAKFGRSLWQPPEQRSRQSLLEWETPDRPAYEQRPVRQKRAALKPWQKRLIATGKALALRAGIWAGTTLVAWLLELHWHLGSGRQTLIGAALFLPSTILVILLAMTRVATKRTRKSFLRWLFGGRR